MTDEELVALNSRIERLENSVSKSLVVLFLGIPMLILIAMAFTEHRIKDHIDHRIVNIEKRLPAPAAEKAR